MGKRRTYELPENLAQHLDGDTRRALDHLCRRRILRAFASGARPKLTPADLVCPDCQLSCANYHLRVLDMSGLISGAGAVHVEGATHFYFSSSIGNNKLVLTVLKATEKSDQRRSAAADN